MIVSVSGIDAQSASKASPGFGASVNAHMVWIGFSGLRINCMDSANPFANGPWVASIRCSATITPPFIHIIHKLFADQLVSCMIIALHCKKCQYGKAKNFALLAFLHKFVNHAQFYSFCFVIHFIHNCVDFFMDTAIIGSEGNTYYKLIQEE